MEIRSVTKYARMSPKKVHMVARSVVGMQAEKALQLLRLVNKKSAGLVAKTLASAIANANCKNIESNSLYIKDAIAEQGVMFHRSVPASRGSAHPIRKRTSHIKVVLIGNLKENNKESK
ncbi:MAG: 50S ribosomal protein L22 [Puniceicoccales bacterium]|jgi:large subunit ribosomal protein L22|nr:50S ribosomal protein L22 [Puniceicoccales bacterium]